MERIISTALEEICARGEAGVAVAALWPALEPSLAADLTPALKQQLWTALLAVPSLRFQSRGSGAPAAQSVEAAEKLGVTIAGDERLIDSFFGLYNVHSANAAIIPAQRRALKRLAIARKDGVPQSHLAKEFGVDGKSLFYVLKGLECQGLITRQSAVLKTKEVCEGRDSTNNHCVTTNLVYLSRYAKNMDSQQKLEITKEERTTESPGNSEGNSLIKEDVQLVNYLPAMKEICDKLEKANGKVLVISDIKKELGYCGPPKHREWRTVLNKLKDAQIVVDFEAAVNEKAERCLRLLKPFSPSRSVPKTRGCVNDDFGDEQLNFGKKRELSNQFVELPIEHQIFDIIDASGSEGLTVIEICKQLGIDNKKNHARLVSMFSRYGMDLQAENQKKCVVYRVWAPGRRNPDTDMQFANKSNVLNDEEKLKIDVSSSEFETPNSLCGISVDVAMKDGEYLPDLTVETPRDTELICVRNNTEETLSELRAMVPYDEPDLVSMELEINNEKMIKKHPFQHVTADGVRREKMILELIQREKFLVKVELLKWLENCEKDKGTKIDRKTLSRLLNKLQQKGQCKCIHINVPYATNCGGRRTIQAILHPSIQSVTPELVSEIHDRLRSFEIKSRVQTSSQVKNSTSVPILKDIQRTKIQTNSDASALKAGAMRANGFVLARMIRTKLLHTFLWDHIYSSEGANVDLSSTECVLDRKMLFSLEAAVKAIPVELFLQVVGSAQTFDSMLEKCRRGLCLSDLGAAEYKSLMDTHATGRLSRVMETLRRLKLIRIVSCESPKDGSQNLQENVTHSLVLNPYIEEPISKYTASLSSRPLDPRPRIRHDFVLITRKAVDEYWQTLEYCYAAADRRAALHAFPGSAVHEVFQSRSWTSIHVMKADQRAELLKRVTEDHQSENLSYKDCGKIASELSLSLEQVLRVYYDKRQSRLNQSSKLSSTKSRKEDDESRELDEQRLASSSDTMDLRMEVDHLVSPEKHEGGHAQNEGGPEHIEDADTSHSVINRCPLSKPKRTRQSRFIWTEETDRQLVMQYTRHRAALGAKYNRTDWSSVYDLPATQNACKKRISLLNSNTRFRRSVMKLCNILSERYITFQEKTQGADRWDDFTDSYIKVALDEVLLCKWMPKPEAIGRGGSTFGGLSDQQESGFRESDAVAEALSGDVQNHGGSQHKKAPGRFRLQTKFMKVLNEEAKVNREAHRSLAISNAVELFKLIFLSTSNASSVPNILARILQRYSEHDLFAAFNYLREKKFMVGGNGIQPFSLSQHFVHNLSKSPFPAASGARAAKFSSLLREREKDLIGGIDLDANLQCGDIFHLFASVFSGQLSLCPCLPDGGTGEAEDTRSVKRKFDSHESSDPDKGKKLKSLVAAEGEIISRREKGFPGLMVIINQTGVSSTDAVNLLRAENTCGNTCESSSGPGIISHSKNVAKETPNSSNDIRVVENSHESPWIVMANYASCLLPEHSNEDVAGFVDPGIFNSIYDAIKKAGDQGLSVGEVSQLMNSPGGNKIPELVISVLQTFGRVLKVNAFDAVHIVDASYRSKYTLTSVSANKGQDLKASDWAQPMNNYCSNSVSDPTKRYSDCDASTSCDTVHKVSVLNFPDEVNESSKISNLQKGDKRGEILFSPELCVPILPWMNGDGTVNKLIFKGLQRRVLGIVMQNPGILEDDIVSQMDVLNPQSCRELVELMVLDKHVYVKKMSQTASKAPPSILHSLLAVSQSETVFRQHFFANPLSTSLL